jgi:hypothetical protein
MATKQMFTAPERYLLTADGKAVRAGDPRGRKLLVAQSGEMAPEEAEKYGLPLPPEAEEGLSLEDLKIGEDASAKTTEEPKTGLHNTSTAQSAEAKAKPHAAPKPGFTVDNSAAPGGVAPVKKS